MSFGDNYKKVHEQVRQAALDCGRNPDEIKILSVSKTRPVVDIKEAINFGIQEFGENRVQEALEKKEQLPGELRFHLIGHLQSNKAAQAAGNFFLIHSIDSIKLAQKLEIACQDKGVIQKILIQVNTANEESKSGITSYPDLKKLATYCFQSDSLQLNGLMTIGAFTEDKEEVRRSFRLCREWKATLEQEIPGLEMNELSMGMSGDYDLAIAEGATLIRIGTALFGKRDYK